MSLANDCDLEVSAGVLVSVGFNGVWWWQGDGVYRT